MHSTEQRNDRYFTPEINSTSCQIVAQCVSADPSLNNASCSVSYGTDTECLGTTTSPIYINTDFALCTASGSGTSVFIFSLIVNPILRIDVIEELRITGKMTCNSITHASLVTRSNER